MVEKAAWIRLGRELSRRQAILFLIFRKMDNSINILVMLALFNHNIGTNEEIGMFIVVDLVIHTHVE